MMDEQYIVAFGDAFNGLSFYGPFDTHEEASAYAERETNDAWHVLPLAKPE
jgi:hypothetical protein